jgi:predicted MFS family arabinose efflux permease
VRHHFAALVPTARTGARLWWRANALPANFWYFLASAILFNLALFVFVLLYNLRLIGLGFHEDFIGAASSASTWGCVAGTIPVAAFARRFGLRFTLTATIVLIATLECLRALATTATPLLIFSFVYGLVFSAWAVVMSPLVAASAPEARRASAYSFFFACMFSTGIVGGWLGGRLPGWVGSTRNSLLIAAGISALALLPALRLTISAPAPDKKEHIYPRSAFLTRFLAFFAVWNLATASFNPFFNTYFQKLHYTAGQIGNVYSLTQLAQTVTILAAPVVLRWVGIARGIGVMMLATAFGLLALAAQAPGAGAAFAYCGYMVFQWMSEPGLTTLLMNNVAEAEREGAAALNYLVAFAAQGIAAFAAGRLIAALGYGPVLAGAAAVAVLAAGLFTTLRRYQT